MLHPSGVGAELLATVIETFRGLCFSRRLAPVVSLSKDLLGVTGKTIALLWQIYLVAGPSFEGVRAYLNQVRSITTDMGCECHIADHKDFLLDFFEALGPDFKIKGRVRLQYRCRKICVYWNRRTLKKMHPVPPHRAHLHHRSRKICVARTADVWDRSCARAS